MVEGRVMKKVIGATEVRNRLGELLSKVYRDQEQLIVEKLGVPVAAIISIKEYEQFQHLLAQEHHRQLGRKLGEEAKAKGLTEEELVTALEDDRQAIYNEMYGRQ